MNSSEIDFRLLQIFQALLRRRQVSLVAHQLGLSQPSVSRGLARLREHFGDPLFVRSQRGMEPTPAALELAPSVEQMLDLYHSQLTQTRRFDPKHSRRRFRIVGSEVGHMLLFPGLIAEIEANAPNLSVEAIPLGTTSLIAQLESGEVDLAFGAYPKLFAGVHERTVTTEHYVCVARRGHPRIGKRLTKRDFEREQHIVMSAKGLGHIHEQIEKQIVDLCPGENIRVVTHSFLVTALLVERSDLIATLPSHIAEALGERHDLQVIVPSFKLPSFKAKMYWHTRFHRDPPNVWLRNTIAGFFGNRD